MFLLFWDCLFLTIPEIDEFLKSVDQHARGRFVYPMVMTAAHTGARRSELIRSRIEDIDFESNTLTLREKKRSRHKYTTRTVPISKQLRTVLQAWFAERPKGPYTFFKTHEP